ncbi:MAG: hypothetical protein ABIG64_00640 [Candidatus Omnitrophota bacterium]
MSINVEIFKNINITTPYDRIYSRLGYVWGKTKVNPQQQADLEKSIKQARDFIDLIAAAAIVKIEGVNGSKIEFEHNFVLKSNGLKKLLIGCTHALFMGATSGEEIVAQIEKNSRAADVTKAVIFDAVASEITDLALNWVVNYYNNLLRRENKTLTPQRFSAGYGDLGIENQEIFTDILKMPDLGVRITDTFLLIPEKSVTAVCGIKNIEN